MSEKSKQLAELWIKEYKSQYKRTSGRDIEVTVANGSWFTVGNNHFKCRLKDLKEYCARLATRPDFKA